MNGLSDKHNGLAKRSLKVVLSALAMWICVPAQAEQVPVDSEALLKMRKPEPPKDAFYSPAALMSMAFDADDQVRLVDTTGAKDCQNTDFRKQATDAGGRLSARECFAQANSKYFQSFDVRAVKGETDLGTPRVANRTSGIGTMGKTAINRMTSRLASRTIGKNAVFKSLIEGKIDMNFSLNHNEPTSLPGNRRPEYTLRVTYKEEPAAMRRLASNVMIETKPVEARKMLPGSSLKLASREIVEVWPTDEEVDSKTVQPEPSHEKLGGYFKRNLGLNAEPFADFHFRLERTGADILNGLSLKLEDISGIAYVDMTQLVRGQKDGVEWGIRLPYFQNSVIVSQPKIGAKTKLGYEYSLNQTVRTAVIYNPNVLEGNISSWDAGRYTFSLAMSF